MSPLGLIRDHQLAAKYQRLAMGMLMVMVILNAIHAGTGRETEKSVIASEVFHLMGTFFYLSNL